MKFVSMILTSLISTAALATSAQSMEAERGEAQPKLCSTNFADAFGLAKEATRHASCDEYPSPCTNNCCTGGCTSSTGSYDGSYELVCDP